MCVLVKGPDVILRTVTPAPVMVLLADAPGRATCPPPRNEGELPEVFFRPDNAAALEPGTLVALLRKRFGVTRAGEGVQSGGAAAEAPVSKPVALGVIKPKMAAPAPLPPRMTPAKGAPSAGASKPKGLSRGIAEIRRQLRVANAQLREEREKKEREGGGADEE